MSQYPYPQYGRPRTAVEYAQPSVLPSYMNLVYAWMCVGLAVTALVAWYTANNFELLRFVRQSFILLILVELGLVFVISYAVNKISPAAATGLFVLYAAINGLTLSGILLIYTPVSVAGTFVATAGMFGVMSLIGFVTKKDLTSLGGFLLMALVGLIIASIINMFWANSTLYWIITYAGIFIFLGLTAYDTQKIKEMAYATEGDPRMASRTAIIGSLILYLDFINLFLLLLRLLGSRRE